MKLLSLEHRRSPRLVSERYHGQLIIGGKPSLAGVVDLSFYGFGVQTDQAVLERARSWGASVELILDKQRFVCNIRHTRREVHHVIAGIVLSDGLVQDVSFKDQEDGWDLVRESDAIFEIFTDLAFKGPECLVHVHQLSGRASLIPLKIQEGQLVCEIFTLEQGQILSTPSRFQFDLFQTCYSFEGKVSVLSETQVTVALPSILARLLRRETVRIAANHFQQGLRVFLQHPLIGPMRFDDDAVVDAHEHGIALLDRSLQLSLPRGYVFAAFELKLGEHHHIPASAQVRSYRWSQQHGGYILGLQLAIEHYSDITLWNNSVLKARYPSLDFTYEAQDHARIWELFDRSGYLDLKPREAFSHVFDVTRQTWQQLSVAGTEISKRAQIKLENKVVGHLQMDRIYPDTWCAHHLAIDPSVSKIVGKDLYSITADVLSAEGASYIFSLTEAAKPWNQRNYYDFVKNYRFPEHNEIKVYQIYEVELGKSFKLAVDSRVSCQLADNFDHARILRHFELAYSQLEREACGLNTENLNLSPLHQMLEPYGLSRGREFIVAKVDGHMVGFGQLETGTVGVNIFGLLDMLYVHVIDPRFKQDTWLMDSIIAACLQRYRELGREDIIVALDDQRSQHYIECGFVFIWDGIRWLSCCQTAKRFHAYSQRLYGHLLLKREIIRQKQKK